MILKDENLEKNNVKKMILQSQNNKTAYDFEFQNINGGTLSLSTYKNKIIVFINVALQNIMQICN